MISIEYDLTLTEFMPKSGEKRATSLLSLHGMFHVMGVNVKKITPLPPFLT